MKSKEDYLQELHEDYLRNINESGLPLYLSHLYDQQQYKEEGKGAGPLFSYQLFWLDEFDTEHLQYCDGHSMYEAMSFIENQAMQFGYKQCKFTRVEIYNDDPDHPLPSDKWDGDDLPF